MSPATMSPNLYSLPLQFLVWSSPSIDTKFRAYLEYLPTLLTSWVHNRCDDPVQALRLLSRLGGHPLQRFLQASWLRTSPFATAGQSRSITSDSPYAPVRSP